MSSCACPVVQALLLQALERAAMLQRNSHRRWKDCRMRLLAFLSACLTLGSTGPTAADDWHKFIIRLKDLSYSLGEDAPVVNYVIYDQRPGPGSEPKWATSPTSKVEGEHEFLYGHKTDGLIHADFTGKYLRAEIDLDNLLPTNPSLLVAQLENQNLGRPPTERTITLQSYAQFSELNRSEVKNILRLSNLDEPAFERAFEAALGAINYKHELDNYLLFNEVVRSNVGATNVPMIYSPAGPDELQAILPGFGDLDFSEQWLIMVNLLDILAAARDPERRYGTAGTVRDAGIQLGNTMLNTLASSDADLSELPVVRVYQHMSGLHAAAEDCVSLAENADRALENANATRMSWSVQRRLFLEWGTCLEKITGFGTGPTREAIIDTAKASPFLSQLWASFAEASERVIDRLKFATSDADKRIYKLHAFSKLITERSP